MGPPEVPIPQQPQVPKPKSLKCWICWLTMGHLVASILSFIIFGAIVHCHMKSRAAARSYADPTDPTGRTALIDLPSDEDLLSARLEIINIDGTPCNFYGK